MGNNKRGNLVQRELEKELDRITGPGKTEVTYDTEEDGYFVKFLDSKRIYKVSIDGDVEYLGKEDELLTRADITANPESNTTPKLTQEVELTLKTLIDIGDVDYTLVCAWSDNNEQAPADNEFTVVNLQGEGRTRKATVTSDVSVEGNYYLWVRAVVGEIEQERCFGPYAIKDHTMLVSTSTETTTDSGFLGNENIQRAKIKSITIQNRLNGHSINDANTWDVTDGKKGKYLAWYTGDETNGYDVTIEGDGGIIANTNSSYLFANIGSGITDHEVTITGLEYLDTELTTNMSLMFNNCKANKVDVNNFNTRNVTIMGYTFNKCSSLTSLDLTNFNTSNVTNMQNMFNGCSSLTSLDLTNFNTSNVTNMQSMFNGCSSLTNLDVSNFNTSSVTNMGYMFNYCSKLISLDLSNFNTQNVTNMNFMFAECHAIKNVNLSGFNTKNVTDMSWMFQACMRLKEINFGETFYTENVLYTHYMFQRCNSLNYLDLSNFNMQNVKSWGEMFTAVPSTIEIKTNQTMKDWILANFTNIKESNITVVD